MDLNIILHNVNYLLQFCDEICIIELYDSKISQLTTYLNKQLASSIFKIHYIRIQKNGIKKLFNSNSSKEYCKYIFELIETNKSMNNKFIHNFCIFKNDNLLLDSFKKCIDKYTISENTLYEFEKYIYYISCSKYKRYTNVTLMFGNDELSLNIQNFPIKQVNGLVNIKNKSLLLNKYKYIEVYNYFKDQNDETNSKNDIYNSIISLLKSNNSKLLDETMNVIIYEDNT